MLCFKCDAHAGCNGNSERFQSFRVVTIVVATNERTLHRDKAMNRKAKKFGQGRPNPRGGWPKKYHFPIGGPAQILGGNPNTEHVSYTYRFTVPTELSTFRFTFAAWVSKSLYYFPPPFYLASSTLSLTILASTRSWTSTWVYSVSRLFGSRSQSE